MPKEKRGLFTIPKLKLPKISLPKGNPKARKLREDARKRRRIRREAAQKQRQLEIKRKEETRQKMIEEQKKAGEVRKIEKKPATSILSFGRKNQKGLNLSIDTIKKGLKEEIRKDGNIIKEFERKEAKNVNTGFSKIQLFAKNKIVKEGKTIREWENDTAKDIRKTGKKVRAQIKKEKKDFSRIKKKLAKPIKRKTKPVKPQVILTRYEPKGVKKNYAYKKIPHTEKKTLLMSIIKKIFGLVKRISRPIIEERPLLPEKSTITTIYDSIYAELKMKKIVEVRYLSKKYNMETGKLIELAKNFEETGRIEIIYPIIGPPKLALKEKGELADETA